jgi:hypothetical protein
LVELTLHHMVEVEKALDLIDRMETRIEKAIETVRKL